MINIMVCVAGIVLGAAAADTPPMPDCYRPIDGGFEITLTADPSIPRPATGSQIGVVDTARSAFGEGHAIAGPPGGDNPRLHRRPLYPPSDKALLWNEAEREKLVLFGFRPLVLAYNEPRFLFDLHSAGGLAGHLIVGLVKEDGTGKWLHEWPEITVRYVDGRMCYSLSDPAFPGVKVVLEAAALSDSVGIILKMSAEGLPKGTRLVWAYGGASAFFTNYAMNAKEFSFAPEQCAKNLIELSEHQFTLTRGFAKPDAVLNEPFAAARHLKDWKLKLSGGSSWKEPFGWGAPEAFVKSPAELLATAEWSCGAQENRVAVQRVALPEGHAEGCIVVGAGGNIAEAIQHPSSAWAAALARNAEIAGRVTVNTPDPHLNAAVTMMAFATDGTWGDSTVMHGAWSWRFGYLGWRGWYGSNCYGWTDRIQRAIRNQVKYGLIKEGDDAGAISSLLDTPGGVFYNMNEVFLDQVRQYFDYTNDLDLMRGIFPALKSILAWEDRRLQPGNADLYENALNTWISDSHWYIGGQCAQASAYMLGANTFMARLAEKLGEDPAPFRDKAARIRAAMQQTLWMADKGVFAEYRDTRGAKLLHTEPELPTIYHAAEFGAADPAQIGQMLDWAHLHLDWETTPGDGRLVWSSNWYPNSGRSYTHSTHEMAYAEELNFALTHYLAGRANEAYRILRASLCGVYNGPTPGGLSCHSTKDGRQRANDEFSDAISMWGRTVTEGLFGIQPHLPDGYISVTPQFPSDWAEASIHTPLLSYTWERDGGRVRITWEAAGSVPARFRVPLGPAKITGADTGGAVFTPEEHDELAWGNIDTGGVPRGQATLLYTPVKRTPPPPPVPLAVAPITPWKAPAGDHDLNRWTLVDLAAVYNATIVDALARVEKEAPRPANPASQVGFDYWRSHLGDRHHGDAVQMPSDAAWRAKVGADGVAWTTDGIPFKTVKEGNNIGIVTQAGAYPLRLEFPVSAVGKTLYLMISGESFPVQSHMPHLRVTLHYTDGTEQERLLVSPFGIGDCWSTWCGRWHDTAVNGFENLGGRFGPKGSLDVADLRQPVNVDTEAHLVSFPLHGGKTLETVRMEAVANDIIFGIMGATVEK